MLDFIESDETAAELAACEQRIGYTFRDRSLLRAALTHASSADHRLGSNERLEFLGDAILGAIVCELLYHRFPRFMEGDLTKIKSVVVSRQACARISEELGLEEFLVVGKGMSVGRNVPPSLLADVFESLVAAVHLDSNGVASPAFVQRHMEAEIERATMAGGESNYKSLLQHFAQRQGGATPTYVLLDEVGPDHAKCFFVSARVGTRSYPPAWGKSKKEAEQRAAANALAELNGEAIPFPPETPPV